MARLAKDQSGITLVEVVVAAFVLTLGSLAVFGVLAAATINTQRAQGTQVATDRAQQEMEALRSLSKEELALTESPKPSSDPLNPDYRVNVNNHTFAIERGTVPSGYEKLVVEGGPLHGGGAISGGNVNPGPEPFTSGEVSGEIYRYIVWRNDPNCSEESCPGTQDYKQIIVAVKLDQKDNEASERGYVEVQSDFIDPTKTGQDNPVPGAEGVATAQQFFLSDTPCSASGETARVEIAGDHALHNTLGTCASGLQAGSTVGAPDALLRTPPPDPAPQDPEVPTVYDYSDDYTPAPSAETAKGIQIRRDATSTCHYDPTGATSEQEWEVHRWVSDRMASEFVMSNGEGIGSATLDFFTRALNDKQYTGKLCIFLFDRHEEGSPPVATDSWNGKAEIPYWEYVSTQGNGFWWTNEWEEVRDTMEFSGPVTIPPGDRLGVALSVERSGTGGENALDILYDHPDYRSRLEVPTTTPLEGG
ncbi:MAG TPA: hypothetical protein VFN89_03400 [Solirubrobacterales bacterium]|nr:hypothetical protein [Solirubrobacterales bacterium]